MTHDGSRPLVSFLMFLIVVLMLAIVGLFWRMIQLQRTVLAALGPMQVLTSDATYGSIGGLAVGTRAPEFALKDVTGETVALNDFVGQSVLLGFSSPHCPACQAMYQDLRTFTEKNKDVLFIMISLGLENENQRMAQEQGFGFPVLTGGPGITKTYRIPGTPFFYLIDRNGEVKSKGFANGLAALNLLLTDAQEERLRP
jgi:methylamine dehydrogenase accessory protein MauD